MQKINLNKYKTLIFDCDGVILDSNNIKSLAFKKVVDIYGHKYSNKLFEYHKLNGGISRYEKFIFFYEKIIKKEYSNSDIIKLSNSYSKIIYKELCFSENSEYLDEIYNKFQNHKWLMITGGDQIEVRNIFNFKKLNKYFNNKNIFGSPANKNDIMKTLIKNKKIIFPAIYFGDSKYDYEVSIKNGIKFVFVSNWTEFNDWKNFCKYNNILAINNLGNLLI